MTDPATDLLFPPLPEPLPSTQPVLFLTLTPPDAGSRAFYRDHQTVAAITRLGYQVDWITPAPRGFATPLPPGVLLHPMARHLPWRVPLTCAVESYFARRLPCIIHAVDHAVPMLPTGGIPLVVQLSQPPIRRALRADAILAHTPELLDFTKKRIRTARARTALLTPLPAAESPLTPVEIQAVRRQYLRGQKDVLLAYAGPCHDNLGFALLLDALPKLRERLPGTFRLLLIPTAPGELRPLRNLVKRHAFRDHILLPATADADAVQAILAASDVLLAPCVALDEYPSYLVDYAFSGTPVLATQTPANQRFLPPDGAVFADPTPSAFAHGLVRLLAHYDTALGHASRLTEHLSLHFSPGNRATEIRLAYDFALNRTEA